MRRSRRRTQISTKVKLRPDKNDDQEARQNGDSQCVLVHVLNKTELRQDWLRGQANSLVQSGQPIRPLVRLSCYTNVCKPTQMNWVSNISSRRALAILGCVALLYFAAGGVFVHQHTGGPDTACHVCQSVHVPTLASAPLDLIHEARQVAWHAVLPENVSPLDAFATHRASRAPPSA